MSFRQEGDPQRVSTIGSRRVNDILQRTVFLERNARRVLKQVSTNPLAETPIPEPLSTSSTQPLQQGIVSEFPEGVTPVRTEHKMKPLSVGELVREGIESTFLHAYEMEGKKDATRLVDYGDFVRLYPNSPYDDLLWNEFEGYWNPANRNLRHYNRVASRIRAGVLQAGGVHQSPEFPNQVSVPNIEWVTLKVDGGEVRILTLENYPFMHKVRRIARYGDERVALRETMWAGNLHALADRIHTGKI